MAYSINALKHFTPLMATWYSSLFRPVFVDMNNLDSSQKQTAKILICHASKMYTQLLFLLNYTRKDITYNLL